MSEHDDYLDGDVVKAACDRLTDDLSVVVRDWISRERERGTKAATAIAALTKALVLETANVVVGHSNAGAERNNLRNIRNAIVADINLIADSDDFIDGFRHEGDPGQRLHS